ncbi:MAG TPA: response regulator transcription factor [Bacteroidia bacterium]|jgi:DNA-binding response OmpR family regulator|nr:response regulator transcription factor [Bacteroidia bacterium]
MPNSKTKILLVDDDEAFGFILKKYLEANNFLVDKANNAEVGYNMFRKTAYSLCLLDVMMPAKNGFVLAKEIKALNKQIPIIFITASSIRESALVGFNAGADDYVVKPFSLEELLMRMQAILRRMPKTESTSTEFETYDIGLYTFNFSTYNLTQGVQSQKLTTKEAQLLHLLVVNKNALLNRAFALQTIWHDISYLSGRSMDVYINKLRKYLSADKKVQIVNIPKQGYMLSVKP